MHTHDMYLKNSTNIDRKTAGRILRVSIRTIDRYIRRGKLTARQSDGRIWLDREEVMRYAPAIGSESKRQLLSITPQKSDTYFYKNLYEEAHRALTENQHILQQAQYRIGQLESQIMHIVPKEQKDETVSILLYKKELETQEKQLEALKQLLKQEKMNRTIFALITYLLLLLLPLIWYLLR